MSKSYIKEVEENLMYQLAEMEQALNFTDAMTAFGSKFFESHREEERDLFFKGLASMRHALWMQYEHRMSRAFALASVSEKLRVKARTRMLSLVEKYDVSYFLDKYGQSTKISSREDSDNLKNEIKEKLK